MFEFLQSKITETIEISEQEFEFAKSLFIPKKLRKKRFLYGEGDICKYTVFVEKGLLRSFTVDDKGGEHILVECRSLQLPHRRAFSVLCGSHRRQRTAADHQTLLGPSAEGGTGFRALLPNSYSEQPYRHPEEAYRIFQ